MGKSTISMAFYGHFQVRKLLVYQWHAAKSPLKHRMAAHPLVQLTRLPPPTAPAPVKPVKLSAAQRLDFP